jgi:hypothetical protein
VVVAYRLITMSQLTRIAKTVQIPTLSRAG